jgi:hypothetical protein
VAYGRNLPAVGLKGDLFIDISVQPTRLYKYNGKQWIEVNKSDTDQYAYNQSYIDFLISSIDAGRYDPELLTDGERAQIEQRLQQ